MELETLIRETLREHAADAPTRVPDVAARPRRWLYAGLAAALVAGLAVGAVALRSTHGSGAPASPVIPAAPHVPAGYKAISYHGITLAVPASLPVLNAQCGSGDSAYVLADADSMAWCPAARSNPEIRLEPRQSLLNGLAGNFGAGRPHALTIDGKPASWEATEVSGSRRSTGELDLPDPGVQISVQSDWHTVEAVLHSVHVTPVNWLGCSDRNPTPYPRRGSSLVPPSPTSAVMCTYAGGGPGQPRTQWLLRSAQVPNRDLSSLVTQLNGLSIQSATSPPAVNGERGLLIVHYSRRADVRLLLAQPTSHDQWWVMSSDGYVEDQFSNPLNRVVYGDG